MDSVWYYVVNDKQIGPVTMAELKDAAAIGKLDPDDLVWQENTPDWVPARTVAGLFPALTVTHKPVPTAPPKPTYSVSPPPPAAPAPRDPEPLSLDDEDDTGRRRPKARKVRDDGGRDRPAGAGLPPWVNLIQVFALRLVKPGPAHAKPEPGEDIALTRAGVMDATTRKLAVWRRAILFAAAIPCGFAALFGLIDVVAMSKEDREPFSALGMLILYIQAFALFALPAAAIAGALTYDRLVLSARLVLIGGLISLAVPLAVAFVPSDWVIELKTDSRTTVQQVEQAKGVIGLFMGIQFYLLLVPAVLSLLPAVSRSCVLTKLLLPESLVPGWGLVTSAPLCVLLTLATFVLVYHVAGNALLLIGLSLWIGGPLLYLTRFELLTRPITSPADRAAIARTMLLVFGVIAMGMMILVIYLFTAKFSLMGGKTLVGFDETTSLMRPWKLDLHKKWIEYLGRSMFLTVFFSDLLLRMALSVWKEERVFAGSAESAGFDRTMSGLQAAVAPSSAGSPPPATAE